MLASPLAVTSVAATGPSRPTPVIRACASRGRSRLRPAIRQNWRAPKARSKAALRLGKKLTFAAGACRRVQRHAVLHGHQRRRQCPDHRQARHRQESCGQGSGLRVRKRLSATDEAMLKYTVLRAIFTGSLAVIAFMQMLLFVWQLRLMRQSTDDAATAATA